MSEQMLKLEQTIAQALNVKSAQVQAVVRLLDDGATVPFIARYRKEETGGLNDEQLRFLAERLYYLRELNERRTTILNTIKDLEKLTPELEAKILAADTKTRLEDLYLPFRPKRKTKAAIAIAAGLEPLAMGLLEDPSQEPLVFASQFIKVDQGVETAEAALEGARHILMDYFSENAELLNTLREHIWDEGILESTVSKAENSNKKQDVVNKYKDYFSWSEPLKKIPSHRALALFRGRRESILQLRFQVPEEGAAALRFMASAFQLQSSGKPADAWLMDTLQMTWKVKLLPKLELELLARLRESADEEAIKVFATNLKDLLLAAPAGAKVTLGLDPGIRTGVKVVVIDATGKLLDYTTIFPFAPNNEWHQSIAELAKLVDKYHVNLVSIGNGTGSRDTERLVTDLIKMYPDLKLIKMVISEAGASVYSASELASKEFPDVDVSIRGAISIARRLQDPLAELVKIEPKSIGVGQYQHDVNQTRLARTLTGVVENCVNAVGVDVNTASAPLLAHVSGLNETLAKNLVEYRDIHGAYPDREALKKVPRMGDKTFQQAAGFLRITTGNNPLDASAVHPETYSVVEKILNDLHVDIKTLMGNKTLLQTIALDKYIDDQHGMATLQDILAELEKPGRDPRPAFKTAQFKEGVEDIKHLEEGMILEGVVSNVTNFGAFVDIGVHQDGLVHISSMTHKFIKDPREVVKAGDIITVRVLEVDKERRRIGLSMKLTDEAPAPRKPERKTPSIAKPPVAHKKKPDASGKPFTKPTFAQKKKAPEKTEKPGKGIFNTAMADALAKLKRQTET